MHLLSIPISCPSTVLLVEGRRDGCETEVVRVLKQDSFQEKGKFLKNCTSSLPHPDPKPETVNPVNMQSQREVHVGNLGTLRLGTAWVPGY